MPESGCIARFARPYDGAASNSSLQFDRDETFFADSSAALRMKR
jgi:hypothetical protein